MFQFSSRVIANKPMKLADVLKMIHASKEVREDAIKISNLTLAYVINAERINCQPDDVYKEIYIFEIELNVKEIPSLFIKALDKTVKFHTFFVLKYKDAVATTMCFKRFGKNLKLEKYHPSEFDEDKEIPLPDIVDVPEAYKFFYSYQMGIPYRKSETPEELFQRIATIRKLRYDIKQLEEAVARQLQPKKKYEYHQRVTNLKSQMAELLRKDN